MDIPTLGYKGQRPVMLCGGLWHGIEDNMAEGSGLSQRDSVLASRGRDLAFGTITNQLQISSKTRPFA